MTPAVLLVALLLAPACSAVQRLHPAPSEEEQNLQHYVQALQNVMLSIPTRAQSTGPASASASASVSASPPMASPSSPGTAATGPEEDSVGFLEGMDDGRTTVLSHALSHPTPHHRRTKTPFWAVKPNNVSVVLRPAESFVVHEPEPRPPPVTKAALASPKPRLESTLPAPSPEQEDVPQLLGDSGQPLSRKEILDKIAGLGAQVRRLPLAQMIRPEFKADLRAAREHLKRSLALAEAAEHKLRKMSRSHVLQQGRDEDEDEGDAPSSRDASFEDASSEEGDTSELVSVLDVLFRARSRLAEYLDPKAVPTRLRNKASSVVSALQRAVCGTHAEAQSLIRRLLNNNIRILNLLDVL